MQATSLLALSRPPLNPSRKNRYNIWNWKIKLCFLIREEFDHAFTIHENTFHHVKEKFINFYFNDVLEPASPNLGVMIF